MQKIVIDTNLLIDGSVDDNNYGSRIIGEVINGRLEAYANKSTLAENRLMARKKIRDDEYLARLNSFFESVIMIETKGRLDVVEDYDDNKILESAVESGAEYLITSDNHLLKIEQHENVRIVTPAQFWQIYEESSGSGWRNWISDFIKP